MCVLTFEGQSHEIDQAFLFDSFFLAWEPELVFKFFFLRLF